MTKKRGYGEGQIVQRGENTWLCRYRVGGRRLAKTVRGTKTEAQRALRDLLHAGNKGEHVEPDKLTLGQWIDHWISIGAPGNKRRREVGQRTIERYGKLLRCHVLPTLGLRPLRQPKASEIDSLYVKLTEKISYPHGAPCAHRPRRLPRYGHADAQAVAQSHARTCPRCPLLPSRITAWCLRRSSYWHSSAASKARRCFRSWRSQQPPGRGAMKILALQWVDLDIDKKTLRIERAIEETNKQACGQRAETERGNRTIAIDAELLSVLFADGSAFADHGRRAGRRHGRPSLVKLPDRRTDVSESAGPRWRLLVHEVAESAEHHEGIYTQGYPARLFRFVSMICVARMRHYCSMRGVPMHVVAARCGHDPAVHAAKLREADEKGGRDSRRCYRRLFKGCIAVVGGQVGSRVTECCKSVRGVIIASKCLILQRWKGGRVV